MYAARAAATAARSCVRREPISISGRPPGPPAAVTIREAADAMAQSWFMIDSTRVSRRTASANVPSTTMMGDPGKYTSPSAYPQMFPPKRYDDR